MGDPFCDRVLQYRSWLGFFFGGGVNRRRRSLSVGFSLCCWFLVWFHLSQVLFFKVFGFPVGHWWTYECRGNRSSHRCHGPRLFGIGVILGMILDLDTKFPVFFGYFSFSIKVETW